MVEFNELSESQLELVYKAPVLVCILIAGADGEIDKKEIKEAIKIAEKETIKNSPLTPFFKVMAEDFEDKIKILTQSYPHDKERRTAMITRELEGLNDVWKELNPKFSAAYFKLLHNLAQRVANSSGGILGIKSVASEEAEYLSLSMISDPSK